MLSTIARGIAIILSLITWAIIGFIYWIPYLLRVMSYSVVVLMRAAFTGSDASNAMVPLDQAAGFYINGFARIIDASANTSHPSKEGTRIPGIWKAIESLLVATPYLLYTISFWLLLWAVLAGVPGKILDAAGNVFGNDDPKTIELAPGFRRVK